MLIYTGLEGGTVGSQTEGYHSFTITDDMTRTLVVTTGRSAMNWDGTPTPNPTSAGIFCIVLNYYDELGYSHIGSQTELSCL